MQDQLAPSFAWRNPTRIVYGVDALDRLADETRVASGLLETRVFLVTGRSFLRRRGILRRAMDLLAGFDLTLHERAAPFPSPSDADEAAAACRAAGANVVVGIGGGSALDLAKAAAILATHGGTAKDYSTGHARFERPSLPFVAAPTTSGSSSEVTSGAALWDWDARAVFGLNDARMFPTTAIVDPRLAMTMPQTLAANTGMDAFTSAFESYWNIDADPISDALALEVIRVYSRQLVRSAIQGDIESRAACALAATMAGIGYSNSAPNACHAVGSPLTLHWRMEHGQSVAITLSPFLRWCAPAISHKMPPLLAALEVDSVDAACAKVESIIERSGLATRLSALGIGKDDIARIVSRTRWDRMAKLPLAMDADDLTETLRGIV